MWCGARDGCTFEMIGGMAAFGATGGNPSGSRPNFFGRQHLPLTREARMWCGARDSAVLGGLVWDEKWRNNPSVLTAEKFAL